MTAPIQIGDPVQVDETTEILTIVAVDGLDAWCRDGAGGHVQHRLVDLGRARPEVYQVRLRYEDWLKENSVSWRAK